MRPNRKSWIMKHERRRVVKINLHIYREWKC